MSTVRTLLHVLIIFSIQHLTVRPLCLTFANGRPLPPPHSNLYHFLGKYSRRQTDLILFNLSIYLFLFFFFFFCLNIRENRI